jgi:hypothetical protein
MYAGPAWLLLRKNWRYWPGLVGIKPHFPVPLQSGVDVGYSLLQARNVGAVEHLPLVCKPSTHGIDKPMHNVSNFAYDLHKDYEFV